MGTPERSGRLARYSLAGVASLCMVAAAGGLPTATSATDAANPDELQAFVGRLPESIRCTLTYRRRS